MGKLRLALHSFTRRTEELTAVRAVRNGLVSIVPILIIGAISLILKFFPVEWYQEVIYDLFDGFFVTFLEIIYGATFGALSIYMTIAISRSMTKLVRNAEDKSLGAMLTSVVCFFILTGAHLESFGTNETGPKSMFLAIITGLGATQLYLMADAFFKRRKITLFSSGADREFNIMLRTLLPTTAVALLVTLLNALFMVVFNVDSFRSFLTGVFSALFSYGGSQFIKGLQFVALSSLLWFFGIHGSDTLEEVMQEYFAPGLAANEAAAAAGALPTQVLTKEFFDCFVLMGGCGATICLLIAILLFSRNRARRGLGLTAAFPMIFNINELMVFGLPIIFNPVMLLPFLAVPIIFYLIAYGAISLGIVPMITHEVAWTTPIFIGGFYATGSVAGALLQLAELVIGVAVYVPFVRSMDAETEERSRTEYIRFCEYYKESEQELANVRLTELGGAWGELSRELCADVKAAVSKNLVMAYQPQCSSDGACVGVEALMRWRHPVHGVIYPPMMVKLAEEAGVLPELEEAVIKRALADRAEILKKYGEGVKLSINVTGTTVSTPKFISFLKALNEKEHFEGKNLCIEVTEQAALSFDRETRMALSEIRRLGFALAIDDFSMGHTSINYLKDNMFDIIKLDGSLVKALFSHQNTGEIVSSIVSLAQTLNMTVIAEYVETEKQRDTLNDLGCHVFQGWLYSPAVYLE